ncbi:transposase, partial [Sulfitobacter sp. G21635-S1]|nr:transposase [Sulfitobacter sp. G21635-S1]
LPSSAIKDPEIVKILASFDKWPRSDALSRLGLERLNAHLKVSSDLCNSLEDWLENHGLSSDQPVENFRPFTQNTREETQTVETPPAVDNSERHAEIAQSEPPSSISCPAPPALTPENLYRIAGDGLRMMLD